MQRCRRSRRLGIVVVMLGRPAAQAQNSPRCRPQQPVKADMCRAGQNLPRKSRNSRRNRISRLDTDLSMPALEQPELMESAARFLPPTPVRCLAWCFCMGVEDPRRQREAGSSRGKETPASASAKQMRFAADTAAILKTHGSETKAMSSLSVIAPHTRWLTQ